MKNSTHQGGRFEVWLDVAEMRTTHGGLYLEYGLTVFCPTLPVALHRAKDASASGPVYIHDRESGEVWAYPSDLHMQGDAQ